MNTTFTLSGSPYRAEFHIEGRPLEPARLFEAFDLGRPGLERARAAVEAGDAPEAGRRLLDYFRARQSVAWPSWPVEQASGEDGRLEAAPGDFAAAENAMRHVFQPYSAYPPTDYGPDIDWDWDPHGNIEWPAHMHRMASWDLSAARCYAATGDERYARLWVDLTWDWIRKYPLTRERCYFPQSWDAIQVGIRATRWCGLLPHFLRSEACVPEFLAALLAALHDHARKTWLTPYPNVDNFLVIESAGLADVALAFPEFADAAAWREQAFAQLDTAAREQVLPDGVHGELSPGYHLYCAGLFLNAADLALRNGHRVGFVDAAERMAGVLLGIATPERCLPVVGDAAPADTRPFLRKAARSFERPDFLAAATDGARGAWPGWRNAAYADGGFFAFRSDWSRDAVWLCLHCGPRSVQPSAFHAQFDNGTFELMAGGRTLMRDPGVYCYARGHPDREAFRRTAAHQTLTLNGANSDRSGRLLQWVDDDGQGNAVLTVENLSYPGLAHRRTVFFVQRRLFVLVDEAIGDARGDIDLHFQLAPGPAHIDPAAKTARTGFPAGANVLVWADARAPVTLEAEEGWFSPEHNRKEPLPAFRYRHALQAAPARFLTVLAPWRDGDPPVLSAALEGDVGAGGLDIRLAADGRAIGLRRRL